MSESLVDWNTYLEVASLSDIGMRRATNQDNMSVALASSIEHWQQKGHLFIVADGMGAHAAGELASKLAIDHIPHLYARFNEESNGECLRKAMSGANGEIHRRGQLNEEFHNMGTTCSSLLLMPGAALVGHIGDSRVYRLSNNRLEQLTFDHSLVWEMKAAGQLTAEEEATNKVPKNVITRSLGPYPECKVDVEGPFPLKPGDTFLLCSDGLTGVIKDDEMGSIMANMSPNEAVRVMVDLANLRGGPDNITVVIVKVNQPVPTDANQTTNNKNSQTGDKNKGSSTPVIVASIVLALSMLFVLMFLLTGSYLTAVLPGVAASGSLLFLAYQFLLSGVSSDGSGADGKVFGRGPYVRVNCPSGESFAKQMSKLLKEVQAGAVDKGWKVDWDRLKTLVAAAESAVAKKQFSKAVAGYGRAISFMMDQLRNQSSDSGSSVDL